MPPTESGFQRGYNPFAKEFYPISPQEDNTIQEVWAEDLEYFMSEMAHLVQEGYNVISMDTEFPGVVIANPPAHGSSSAMWQTIQVNVNLLRIIQLGLSFADRDGNPPPGRSTYQINFAFDLDNDMYAVDSIKLLSTSGIDFHQLREHGCSVSHFSELLTSSGLVLNDEVTWVSFHSGYDFGYLVKLLSDEELPDEASFFQSLVSFFPNFYDTKYMAKECATLHHSGGLDSLAQHLQVPRIGPAHQAGSDSLLTSKVFFSMVKDYFLPYGLDVHSTANTLFGLGRDAPHPQPQPAMLPEHCGMGAKYEQQYFTKVVA